jgi:hypothetical protein
MSDMTMKELIDFELPEGTFFLLLTFFCGLARQRRPSRFVCYLCVQTNCTTL